MNSTSRTMVTTTILFGCMFILWNSSDSISSTTSFVHGFGGTSANHHHHHHHIASAVVSKTRIQQRHCNHDYLYNNNKNDPWLSSSTRTAATRLFATTPPLSSPPPPPPISVSTSTSDLSVVPPGLANQIDEFQRQVTSAWETIERTIDFDSLQTKLTSSSFSSIPVTDQMMQTYDELLSKGSALINEVMSKIGDVGNSSPLGELSSIPSDLLEKLQQWEQSVSTYVSNEQPHLMPYYQQAQTLVKTIMMQINDNVPTPLIILGSAYVSYVIVSSFLGMFGPPKVPAPVQPYPIGKYDPSSAQRYFEERPMEVIQRGIEVALLSLTWGIKLLQDKLSNKIDENSEVRAIELAQLLTKLGPSFIKIGQSLSIRTDLLSPAYVKGLQTLQDQVPPFDSSVAKQMMRDEWGVTDLNQVFSKIGDEPVAAASLGQVYRGTLKDGNKEVAIKVQRPNIMNQIALDMHLLRTVAPILKTTFNLNTDLVGTVDAWGKGFVDELDYMQEATNANVFMEEIQTTPLKDVVFAPTPIERFTTKQILTTEWIVGERLDRSSQQDVTVLCSIAMNTYLTMMLEIGLLHCDPHPGNLLRTSDGKLCILDWGMVTRLNENLQLTLIEHMAHLTSADYDEIPNDLLLLGFIPEEKASEIKDSGLVSTLANIYGAWTAGGGAAAMDVNQVIVDLQELQATKGNLFRIPPYFAYIAKSFSVLEGIGLSNNPKYSIINECLPYVSKRLLTDQSERTGGALNTFIFGPDKSNIETRIIDYKRVEQLVTGFGSYSTSASGGLLGTDDNVMVGGSSSSTTKLSRTQLLEKSADQILDLIATEEETPLQDIFVEQLAKIVTASSRSIWHDLRERSGKLPSGRSVLGTIVDPLGLWRTSPLVQMNDLDQKTVDNTRKLIELVRNQASTSGTLNAPDLNLSDELSRDELIELSSILVRKIWDKRRGVFKTSRRLARQLLQLTADKLENGERGLLKPPPSIADEVVSESTNDSEKVTTTTQRPVSKIEKMKRVADSTPMEEVARVVPTSSSTSKNSRPMSSSAKVAPVQSKEAVAVVASSKPPQGTTTVVAEETTTTGVAPVPHSASMPIPPPPPTEKDRETHQMNKQSERLRYATEILKEAETIDRTMAGTMIASPTESESTTPAGY